MSHLKILTRDQYFEYKLKRNWMVRTLSHLKITCIYHHVRWHPSMSFWAISRYLPYITYICMICVYSRLDDILLSLSALNLPSLLHKLSWRYRIDTIDWWSATRCFELTWTITRALWSFIFIKWMVITKLGLILYSSLFSRNSLLSKVSNRKNKINDFFELGIK